VWDFHSSLDKSDLIKGFNVRRETSMDAKDFSFNNGSNSKIVKDFSAIFPGIGIAVLSDSLVIESIYSSNLSGFVVTSQ
jgi:hypothetical protein